MKKPILLLILGLVAAFFAYKYFTAEKDFVSVLVFSKTAGYRHESIAAGKQALIDWGKKTDIRVDTTEDASAFKEGNLAKYNVVVFMNTTGDVLNGAQQLEFNRFIQAGGGFVGVHAAADTEYDWPWYGDLVGAYFKSHPNDPNVREASVDKDTPHECTDHLPERWTRMDEWYNYKDIRSHIKVLLNLDETSYEGGENGDSHPITWFHEFDGGRSFYTGVGHTNESFENPEVVQLITNGILWSAGPKRKVDFNRSTVAPEENRFQKVVLADNLNEPMELEMLPDGRILFVERRGDVKLMDVQQDSCYTINTIPVFSKLEDGLLGMALDPNFAENNWVYLYYSPLEVAYNQLSRFTFDGEKLDMDSEIKVLEVATQRDTCCHSGGSLEFGPGGNLYLSTGDNTNPFESDGFGPIDETPGRKYFDAQRTSANTNDLRGKILRIHPEPDGTYTIPEGNLFVDEEDKTRPEIYIMGCRNPYRIHVDDRTGYLYWGDVGPDAGEDSTSVGSKGHDEINQAKQAGFFGWPLFNANNKTYFDRDFASGALPTKAHDPDNPKNISPNNTGITDLPKAQPAYVWYPYGDSEEFPLLGSGGRNAMAGPVFYHADYSDNEGRFPEYYDKKFFAYDWIRGWIVAITQNEKGGIERMERFLPSIVWDNPTDIIFSPQGDMYLLEYGRSWFSQNEDARLIHLKYISGNRPPVAKLQSDQYAGAIPFKVNLSAKESIDYDGDEMTYEWFVNDQKLSENTETINYTFEEPGAYQVKLRITDVGGEVSEVEKDIFAGNDVPKINWKIAGNQSFYFLNEKLEYAVEVSDTEDGQINKGVAPEEVVVSIDYLENGYDVVQVELGHKEKEEGSRFSVGKDLIGDSDCRACHAIDKKIAGPSYMDIAERYNGNAKLIPTIAERIIKGSNGQWGDQLMAAHPQHSQSEAELMVKYILSLKEGSGIMAGLPVEGTYVFNQHKKENIQGSYILNASFTDKGAPNAKPMSTRETIVLRSPIIQAVNYDDSKDVDFFEVDAEQYNLDENVSIMLCRPNGFLQFEQIDLTGINGISGMISAMSMFAQGGTMEVRIDKVDGPLIGTMPIETTLTPSQKPLTMSLNPTKGMHDLFFVFKGEKEGSTEVVAGAVYFEFLKNKPI